MDAKMKLVKMDGDTHKMAKAQAKLKGMTLQGYLMTLVKNDINPTAS